LADQIPATQQHWNALGLDWRHFGVAKLCDHFQEKRWQIQVTEMFQFIFHS
jgi:hypothetical protein